MFNATTLFTLAGKLVLDSNEFNSSVNQAKGTFSGLGSSMDSTISKIKRGLIAITGGVTIGKLLQVGISFNSQIDSYEKNFGVLLQNTQRGIELTQQLKDKAMATPFNVTDLAGATQSLLAYGIAGEDVLGILDTLGDIALGDKTKLQSIATVFGQISMAGKLLTQDYKQLLGQGFNPLTYISKRTGESLAELQDRMSKGQISVEEVTQAFKDATSEGGQFYKGAEVGATTFEGRLSTLKGTWQEFIGQFTAPITQNLADKIFPALTDSLNAISAALFGVEEQSQKTRAELYGTDESGNEINPNANLETWYERLINTWTDGLPETDTIVSDYVDEFTRESNRVKQAMADALMDESNPLTEEQKQQYETGMADIEAMQARVAELLQKRRNGTITSEEQNELLDYLAKLNEYTNLLLSGGASAKEESPLERFINMLGDKGVGAIEAATNWIVNFINNWPTYQETLKGYIDTVLGWFGGIDGIIETIKTNWDSWMEKIKIGAIALIGGNSLLNAFKVIATFAGSTGPLGIALAAIVGHLAAAAAFSAVVGAEYQKYLDNLAIEQQRVNEGGGVAHVEEDGSVTVTPVEAIDREEKFDFSPGQRFVRWFRKNVLGLENTPESQMVTYGGLNVSGDYSDYAAHGLLVPPAIGEESASFVAQAVSSGVESAMTNGGMVNLSDFAAAAQSGIENATVNAEVTANFNINGYQFTQAVASDTNRTQNAFKARRSYGMGGSGKLRRASVLP